MPEVMTIEPAVQQATDIVAKVEAHPAIVLLDQDTQDAFYKSVKEECDNLVPDTSTAKGRDEIRSLAAKVTRTKTAIDKSGLALTDEWRANTKKVNDARNVVKERFDALAKTVREPLTKWEEEEKARNAEITETVAMLKSASMVLETANSADIAWRIEDIKALEFSKDVFQDQLADINNLRDETINHLTAAHGRIVEAEQQKAELERLRAAESERQRLEVEKQAAAKAELERKEQIERAEAQRLAQEKADQDRIERAKTEAAENARREAEQAKQEELDAANERARKAEQEAKAEKERAAEEVRVRLAEEQKAAAEVARREANEKHRKAVIGKAGKALMQYADIDEAAAKRAVMAIIGNNIPHVTLQFCGEL